MRRIWIAITLAAMVPLASLHAQLINLFPSDGGGNWLVKCTVIAVDAPPLGPCNGALTTAQRVTAAGPGWTPVPLVGPAGSAYYISEDPTGSVWAAAPNLNAHYEYTFRTTFNVVSAAATDAVYLNAFLLDNYWGGWSINGSAFSLSGISPAPLAPNGANGGTAFTLTTEQGYFVSGTNTLELRIRGSGVTDGILVQGAYGTPLVTPEPTTVALLAAGLLGTMIAAGRRRRTACGDAERF